VPMRCSSMRRRKSESQTKKQPITHFCCFRCASRSIEYLKVENCGNYRNRYCSFLRINSERAAVEGLASALSSSQLLIQQLNADSAPRTFLVSLRIGRGGGDRNCIPPLLSLANRRRYRPLPNRGRIRRYPERGHEPAQEEARHLRTTMQP
jgi:hypothetical protein